MNGFPSLGPTRGPGKEGSMKPNPVAEVYPVPFSGLEGFPPLRPRTDSPEKNTTRIGSQPQLDVSVTNINTGAMKSGNHLTPRGLVAATGKKVRAPTGPAAKPNPGPPPSAPRGPAASSRNPMPPPSAPREPAAMRPPATLSGGLSGTQASRYALPKPKPSEKAASHKSKQYPVLRKPPKRK